jgi:hypothetical protein
MQENFILRDSVICDYSDRLLAALEEIGLTLTASAVAARTRQTRAADRAGARQRRFNPIEVWVAPNSGEIRERRCMLASRHEEFDRHRMRRDENRAIFRWISPLRPPPPAKEGGRGGGFKTLPGLGGGDAVRNDSQFLHIAGADQAAPS